MKVHVSHAKFYLIRLPIKLQGVKDTVMHTGIVLGGGGESEQDVKLPLRQGGVQIRNFLGG